MAVDYKKLKVGDKVRYLGGDNSDENDLTVGKEYDISVVDEEGYAYLNRDSGGRWYVSSYNDYCFELVDGEERVDKESPSSCNCDCKHDSHIVNLAKEVAELKRGLSDLRYVMHAQAYEDNERIERILDDIVMLDERTQDESATEPKPVRKVVYEYERYYD